MDLCYREYAGQWELWLGEFVNEDPSDGLTSFVIGVGSTQAEARADAVKAIEEIEAFLQSPAEIDVFAARD